MLKVCLGFTSLSHAANKVNIFFPGRLFIEGLSLGALLLYCVVLTNHIWRIRLQIFVKPYEMAFGGDGSCAAEVTFQAATKWVFWQEVWCEWQSLCRLPGDAGASPPHGSSRKRCWIPQWQQKRLAPSPARLGPLQNAPDNALNIYIYIASAQHCVCVWVFGYLLLFSIFLRWCQSLYSCRKINNFKNDDSCKNQKTQPNPAIKMPFPLTESQNCTRWGKIYH